jgi:hypothetical protein
MALKLSTGLRNRILDTSPLKTIFNLGFLEIYNGTPPASADDALGGATLLVRISNNNTATGITLASTASGGAITKNLSETWSKAAANTGTAAWYRLVAAGDTGLLSTTEPRIQGLCGLAGSDLNLSTLSLVATTVYTIDTFALSLPAN